MNLLTEAVETTEEVTETFADKLNNNVGVVIFAAAIGVVLLGALAAYLSKRKKRK